MKATSLAVVLLLALAGSVIANNCSQLPILQQLRAYNDREGGSERMSMNQTIDELANRTAVWVNGTNMTRLGFCASQIRNQSTCCFGRIMNLFKRLVLRSFQRQKRRKPAFGIVLNTLKMIAHRCGANMDMVDTSRNHSMRSIERKFKICHVRSLLHQIRFLRGSLCAACVDPANLTRYFNITGNVTRLKVNRNSMANYTQAIGSAMQCIEDLQSDLRHMVEIILSNETNTTRSNLQRRMGGSRPMNCRRVKERIRDILNNDSNRPCQGDSSCSDRCRRQARLFQDSCTGGLEANENDTSLDPTDGNTTMLMFRRRVLTSDGSEMQEEDDGINVYVQDSDDSQAQIDGIDPNSSELDPNNPPGGTNNPSNNNTHASLLYLSMILLGVMFSLSIVL